MSTSEPSFHGWWARLQRVFFDRQPAPQLLAAPRAQTLENTGDSGENLLHKNQVREDLRIEFDLWAFSEPGPHDPETLQLFLTQYGEQVVATRTWTAPITPEQCFIMLPQRFLTQGRHELFYKVALGSSGSTDTSEVFPFTIDLTAAELDSASGGQLLFPADALAGVTARYLETHNDRLEAVVPDYWPKRAGDRLSVYWEQQVLGSQLLYERTLSAQEAALPLVLAFTGDEIRSRADGQRFVSYHVWDRAGNRSDLSRAVMLQVDAAPIPRNWPAPTVQYANGDQIYGMLDPLRAANGVKVMVPAAAVFHAGETAEVHWGAHGTPGATVAPAYIEGNGPWPATIGKNYIAAHMGKTLVVNYDLEGDHTLPASAASSLLVSMISGLPTIQSATARPTPGHLSLSAVPEAGDPLTLAPWPLITANTQRIKLWAEGTASTGVKTTQLIRDNVAITSAEVSSGIAARLPLAWLRTLLIQRQFALHVQVSFDGGQGWHDFPSLHLTLVA